MCIVMLDPPLSSTPPHLILTSSSDNQMGTFEDDSFHQKTALFLEWLSPLKGVFLSTKIEIADFRDRKAGRGIGMCIQCNQHTYASISSSFLKSSTVSLCTQNHLTNCKTIKKSQLPQPTSKKMSSSSQSITPIF